MEYIREWLHATGLTKSLIPIPYSDCLLTESDLRNIAPIYFTNGGDLRNSLKVCAQNVSNHPFLPTIHNRKLRGITDDSKEPILYLSRVDRLSSSSVHFTLTRMVYGVQSISRLGTEITRTFCASGCDLFINPRSSLITEFGWSAVHWENGKEIQQDGHLCVQERKYYTNTFIPNNREVSANPGSYTADGIDTPTACSTINSGRPNISTRKSSRSEYKL